MLNLSKFGTAAEVIAEIEALPNSTETLDAETVATFKALAIARVKARPESKIGLHLRANNVPALRSEQFEIQIACH